MMAERRMFTQKITESDAFLDMPMSAQCLYFHLNMNADDDGFVNNPRKIQRMIGAADDDGKLLIAKGFVYNFENGVIVIKHWRMHNLIRKDRYHPTQYTEELKTLSLKENGAYTKNGNHLATTWQPNDNQMATEVSIGKVSIGKDNKYIKHKHGKYKNVLLTDEEYQKLVKDNLEYMIDILSEGKEMKGYSYKSDYLAVRKWAKNQPVNPNGRIKSKPNFDIADLKEKAALNDNFDI